MSKLIVTGSSNISILDSSIITDLCAGKFYISLVPSTFIGSGANNALGAKVRITNPFGVAIKDYASTYDIVAPFTGVFEFNISTSGGNYEYGVFTIDVQIIDADNKTYTVTKNVKPSFPDPKNISRKYGSLGATIKGVCKENKLYVAVDTLPTYNGLLSGAVTQSFDLEYPTGSSLDKATRTISYFSDYLFEGVYKLDGEICATYEDDDNISYRVKYKVSAKKEVLCQIDDCAVFENFKSLHSRLSSNCSEEEATQIGNTILEALGLYTTAKLANDCGEDASDYILRLQELLGCKCTCDFGNAPISDTTPAADIVIDGCNVQVANNGLTKHYTINNYEYIVDVPPNGGFLTVASPQLSGCTYTQTLTFDMAKVYTQVKAYANATMDEAFFWASIVNKAASDATPPQGTTQDAWGAMSYLQRIQTIINRLNAAITAIGNLSVPDVPPPPSFTNGTTQLSARSGSTPSSNGLGGALTANTAIAGAFGLGLTQGAFGVGRMPTMIFDVTQNGGLFSYNGKQAFIRDAAFNINIGEKSGGENTGSGSNINMGYQSGYAAIANYQVALGESSGYTVHGHDGIYIGRLSGISTDGDRNVMIGAVSGDSTNCIEGTLIGYGTSAGDPILNVTIPNSSFSLNTDKIIGLADYITQAGLQVGDRIAIALSGTNVQVGGQPLPGGGQGFKGVVFDSDKFQMLYNGVFTNQGSGQTTLKVFAKTNNVTAVGRRAHATKNNQVALGDDFVTELKLGQKAFVGIHEWSIRLPRVTTTERNGISSTGLIGGEAVYDVTVNKVSVYDKSASGGAGAWKYLAYEA